MNASKSNTTNKTEIKRSKREIIREMNDIDYHAQFEAYSVDDFTSSLVNGLRRSYNYESNYDFE